MVEEDHECEEGAPAWMATFADMSTLLLTFFVLLLSFANMDVVKFREMMGSMKDAFGYQTVHFGNWNPEMVNDKASENSAETHNNVGGGQSTAKSLIEIQKAIEDQSDDEKVEAEASPRGILIRVKDNVMFQPGTDRLKPESHDVLNRIVKLLGRFPCEIIIEGHTDDSHIRTKKFPSNWELSSKRAIATMLYMAEVGGFPRQKLSASGFADTRPLVPNTTPQNRAKNRRVEFVCVRDDESRRRDAAQANALAKDARVRRAKESAKRDASNGAAAPSKMPPKAVTGNKKQKATKAVGSSRRGRKRDVRKKSRQSKRRKRLSAP